MERGYKECPFCGSEEVYMKYNGARYGRFYYVECAVCGGRTRGACRPYSDIPSVNEEDEHEWDNQAANTVRILWNQRSGANA